MIEDRHNLKQVYQCFYQRIKSKQQNSQTLKHQIYASGLGLKFQQGQTGRSGPILRHAIFYYQVNSFIIWHAYGKRENDKSCHIYMYQHKIVTIQICSYTTCTCIIATTRSNRLGYKEYNSFSHIHTFYLYYILTTLFFFKYAPFFICPLIIIKSFCLIKT